MADSSSPFYVPARRIVICWGCIGVRTARARPYPKSFNRAEYLEAVMLMLHLSDIHIRVPNCLNPDTDRDRPYRTRLERDLGARVATLGAIDVILVCGDISF